MKLKRTLGIVLTLALLLPILATGLTMPTVAATTTPADATPPTATIEGDVDVWDGSTSESLAGTGTEEDPYLIGSGADLSYFLTKVCTTSPYGEGEFFEITTNIQLGHDVTGTEFHGVLDGNNKVLQNVTRGSSSNTKYFLTGTKGATIRNITVDGYYNHSNNSYCSFIGAINEGTVLENIQLLNADMAGQSIAGIVADANAGCLVKNCVVSGTFQQSGNGNGSGLGGAIVGQVSSASIINCINYATFTASGTKATGVGGIAGTVSGTTADYAIIRGNINYGNVTHSGASKYANGIIGYIPKTSANYVTVDGNTNYGAVTTTGSGGVAGGITVVTTANADTVLAITNCTNYGDVTSASSYAGGIMGHTGCRAELTNCYNFGNITATNATNGWAAGLIAYTDPNTGSNTARSGSASAVNCGNYGKITGGAYASGLFGRVITSKNGTTTMPINLINVVSVGELVGTSDTTVKSAIGYIRIGRSQKTNLVMQNLWTNAPICIDKTYIEVATVVNNGNVYADTTVATLGAAYAENEAVLAIQSYDTADMVSFADSLNDYIATNSSMGYTPWYLDESGKIGSISELTIDGASVDITHGGAIRMALRVDDVSYLSHDTVSIVKEDAVGTSPLLQNGSAIFLIDAGRIMDAANAYTYSIASGDKTYGQRDIALLEVLAGIYGLSNAEEQALITALVNYVEYTQIAKGQNATAIDTFNQVAGAGTIAKADLTGVALEMNGVHTLAEGYSISLSLDNGFIITASNGENTVNQKVLFTDMDKEVWIGENAVGGKTTVNNMLYIYMTGESFTEDVHNQAKALVLYQQALSALTNAN